MATVREETKTVKTYILKLDEDEAAALLAISGHVLGSSLESPRGLIDNIYDALKKAKVSDKYVYLIKDESYTEFKKWISALIKRTNTIENE